MIMYHLSYYMYLIYNIPSPHAARENLRFDDNYIKYPK